MLLHTRVRTFEQISSKIVALWVETVWNRRIHSELDNIHYTVILFPLSFGVSERASEWGQPRARAKRAVGSKWMSGESEQAIGGANGPVLYTFISWSFYPQWAGWQLPNIGWFLKRFHLVFLESYWFPRKKKFTMKSKGKGLSLSNVLWYLVIKIRH